MEETIRKALPAEATILSDIAFMSKSFWGYDPDGRRSLIVLGEIGEERSTSEKEVITITSINAKFITNAVQSRTFMLRNPRRSRIFHFNDICSCPRPRTRTYIHCRIAIICSHN